MNTCLSSLYLKINQLDSRHFRLAFLVFSFVFGGIVLGIPIHGDVGG